MSAGLTAQGNRIKIGVNGFEEAQVLLINMARGFSKWKRGLYLCTCPVIAAPTKMPDSALWKMMPKQLAFNAMCLDNSLIVRNFAEK